MRLAKIHFPEIIVDIFLVVFFSLVFALNLKININDQYLALSQSFLEGKLYFPDGYKEMDLVLYDSKHYWHQGPLPAVILMPFVFVFDIVGLNFKQGYLQFFISLGIFILCYKIARYFKFGGENSRYLAYAFCFASVFRFIAFFSVSWFFGQEISVFFMLLAIYIYLFYRKHFLTGVLLSLVLATRAFTILGLAFFVFDILYSKSSLISILRDLFYLLLPIGFAGVLLLIYNFVRFESFFETGYLINNPTLPVGDPLFGIRYLRNNFYTYFLKGLQVYILNNKQAVLGGITLNIPHLVAYPSTSFFVVSPVFFYLLKVKIKNKLVKSSLLASIIILLALLLFYYSGEDYQLGPRYLLDLLPFAFIMLLFSFRKQNVSTFAKTLIIFSSLFNLYLFIARMIGNAQMFV